MTATTKVAIVTGGSRGLGRSMALSLAAKGTDVILTYNSRQAEAEEVVTEITNSGQKAAALQMDVSDSKSFPGFAASVRTVLRDAWGRENFDFLVNNAGIGISVPFAETTEEQFDQLMNIQFKGV